MEYGQGARASLPIWAGFMKRCYSDPTLKLDNRNFRIPATVIAVPMSGQTHSPSDSLSTDSYMEYFTPKGFQYYQSHPMQPTEKKGPAAGDSTNTETRNGEAIPPNIMPAQNLKEEKVF